MKIAGLQKTTLLDYPGYVAATVFTAGCNLRCPFCHNADLISLNSSTFSEDYILSFLSKRVGKLDGVCITGGEPTIQPDLPDFIKAIREMGFKIKLDTNGFNPDMLSFLLSGRLLDYCAIDIKSSLANYELLSGVKGLDTKAFKKSVSLLMSSDIDYEFRTTVVSPYHTSRDFEAISDMISCANAYYLQKFKPSESVADQNCTTPSDEFIDNALKICRRNIKNVYLRG